LFILIDVGYQSFGAATVVGWKAEFGAFSGIDSYLAHDVRILLSHDFLEIADLIWRLRRQSIEWS